MINPLNDSVWSIHPRFQRTASAFGIKFSLCLLISKPIVRYFPCADYNGKNQREHVEHATLIELLERNRPLGLPSPRQPLITCLWILGGNQIWRKPTQPQEEHADFT